MKEKYYKWPSAEDRKNISKWIKHQFHFPDCAWCMDGTLNPLPFELQCQGDSDYSGRKYGYSLSTLAVNNDQQRITYYLAGWPGSTHDNHIFKNLHYFKTAIHILVSVNTYMNKLPIFLPQNVFTSMNLFYYLGTDSFPAPV